MNIELFFGTLTAFCISNPVRKKEEFLAELPSGEVIHGKIVLDDSGDEIKNVIDSNGTSYTPKIWISERIGRLSSLARSIQVVCEDHNPFISPIGKYELNWSIDDIPSTGSTTTHDIIKTVCNKNNPWESHVVYLTSNAGEGKTTHLSKIAYELAKEYTPGKGRLIVPFSLSGKPFLCFEDLIIATLANKYKFSGYFYPSFLALVKMGLLIPAFDGFEEMFIVSPNGEAISSMGQLINDLQGKGLVLVAARSAYFENNSLSSQGRLYNTINSHPVVFSKISIDRWGENQFIKYGIERANTAGEATALYQEIAGKVGPGHSILTRAVLVKKLYEAYEEDSNIDDITNDSPEEFNKFFSKFVYTIIERETGKWLMRNNSANESVPVLTLKQHCKLLGMIAKEMWIMKSEELRSDVIDTITAIFIESEMLSPDAAWQVKQRIKDHAVLKATDQSKALIEFDHQDFYQFFLANSAAASLLDGDIDELTDLCRRGRLSKTTLLCISNEICNAEHRNIQELVIRQIYKEQRSSYARENLALLALVLNQDTGETINISQIAFESEPFDSIAMKNAAFDECTLSKVDTRNTLGGITFDNCRIMELVFDKNETQTVELKNQTQIDCIYESSQDSTEYSPAAIRKLIETYFVQDQGDEKAQLRDEPEKQIDDRLQLIEKALRLFFNRIENNEDVFKQKLSLRFSEFWDDILPDLLGSVFEFIQYHGSGTQRRLRIICPLDYIQKSFEIADGNYDDFIKQVNKKQNRRNGFA